MVKAHFKLTATESLAWNACSPSMPLRRLLLPSPGFPRTMTDNGRAAWFGMVQLEWEIIFPGGKSIVGSLASDIFERPLESKLFKRLLCFYYALQSLVLRSRTNLASLAITRAFSPAQPGFFKVTPFFLYHVLRANRTQKYTTTTSTTEGYYFPFLSFPDFVCLLMYSIIQDKYLIIDCPTEATLPKYLEIFKQQNVTQVVRICDAANTYDAQKLESEGITVHDEIKFQDGGVPDQPAVDKWLQLTNESRDVIGVHCVSGIGRAPVSILFILITIHSLKVLYLVPWMFVLKGVFILFFFIRSLLLSPWLRMEWIRW